MSRALKEREIDEILVHTGQHYDQAMSDIFFQQLGLRRPDIALGVSGGGHGEMTGRMLVSLEPKLLGEKPDCVLVYGDTNSTLAGALCAAKLNIPVAHVEAGLRSGDRRMPEEVNRILTDHVSSLLFCPTALAVGNLGNEGISDGVLHTGDVMYDAAEVFLSRARENIDIEKAFGVVPGGYSLATIHRAENTDSRQALERVVQYIQEETQMPVVLPLHPRTRRAAEAFGIDFGNLITVPPVGYLEMLALLDGCVAVLTDSGGLQKEAYFLGRPCITLRSTTEWRETIDHGWNRLWTTPSYNPRSPIDEYGDGSAAVKIAGALCELN